MRIDCQERPWRRPWPSVRRSASCRCRSPGSSRPGAAAAQMPESREDGGVEGLRLYGRVRRRQRRLQFVQALGWNRLVRRRAGYPVRADGRLIHQRTPPTTRATTTTAGRSHFSRRRRPPLSADGRVAATEPPVWRNPPVPAARNIRDPRTLRRGFRPRRYRNARGNPRCHALYRCRGDGRVGLYAGDCFLPIGDRRLKLETAVDLRVCCWSPSIMMSQLLTC